MMKYRNNREYKLACSVVERLRSSGFEAYFAGGFVRDMLLCGEASGDIDIATSASPNNIRELFSNVHAVGESFGVMIVVLDSVPFEVATFREDGNYSDGRRPDGVQFSTAEKDAQRRDFTINGMFYDPLEERVLDYVGGESDLKRGVLRTIGSPFDRFNEDYLRMIRAIRFANRFSFSIDDETGKALKELSHKIKAISPERIFQELNKILTGPNPSDALQQLLDYSILEHILPEVYSMVGVEQPPEFHPEGDVFQHTKLVMKNLGAFPDAVLSWSALLHDVGKPRTMTVTDRIRFNNHHRVGADMSEEILMRLRAPRDFREAVVACVDNHMHFIHVKEMRLSKLKRFLARDTIETELALHLADCQASHGGLDNYYFLKEKGEEFSKEGIKPDPLLQGRDLIKCGLKPSPLFGEVLQEAYDLQLEDILKTKEDALEWLKKSYCK